MAISLNPFSGGFNAIILIRIQSFARASRYMLRLIMFMYHFISIHVHPFWIQFFYFIIIDLLGSLLLMVLKPTDPDFSPRYVDMFFLSTSALTVSGLSTVAMERLSSSQIVVFSLLMLVGGEVFVSMLCVFCRSAKPSVAELTVNRVNSVRIELETIDSVSTVERIESGTDISVKDFLRRGSLKYLGLVIVAYWVFFHVTENCCRAVHGCQCEACWGELCRSLSHLPGRFTIYYIYDVFTFFGYLLATLHLGTRLSSRKESRFPFLKEDEEERSVEPKENSRGITIITKILLLPQVVCVIIFVIVACIIERRRLQLDPLNFSALNVIFEVVSAFGNVGISTGYACSRLQKLHPDMSCVDQPYSFAGWWSDGGKLLIAFVMLYGRLKKFSEKNGKAWTLKG
ncbi:Cation transporter HKT1 [Rhynchospora pubera]|uniref:Cation transporter HKT1 n=1 Tax=Rhynchospora pubera TaxID=906938 RepID=A0AAV8CKZ2_9POAL|nr:Cation transporter HKT1 [Rhynchospora pubera]